MNYDRQYAITRQFDGDLDAAEARVRETLAAEGFGILTEIDVQKTLKEKIDVDRRPYRILGACNPPLANQALEADPSIGLLLPCNVVVFQGDDGATWIQAIRAQAMFAAVDNPAVEPLAEEVNQRLERALDAL